MIMNDLTQAFYKILQLQNSIELIKEQIVIKKSLLDQAQAFLDTGRISAIQLIRRDLELGESELRLVQARGSMLKLEEDLFNILGVDKPSSVKYISNIKYEKIDLSPELIIDSNLNYLNTKSLFQMHLFYLSFLFFFY